MRQYLCIWNYCVPENKVCDECERVTDETLDDVAESESEQEDVGDGPHAAVRHDDAAHGDVAAHGQQNDEGVHHHDDDGHVQFSVAAGADERVVAAVGQEQKSICRRRHIHGTLRSNVFLWRYLKTLLFYMPKQVFWC